MSVSEASAQLGVNESRVRASSRSSGWSGGTGAQTSSYVYEVLRRLDRERRWRVLV